MRQCFTLLQDYLIKEENLGNRYVLICIIVKVSPGFCTRKKFDVFILNFNRENIFLNIVEGSA